MTERIARVIGQERGIYRLADEGEEYLAEVSGRYRFEAKAISDYPVVGDRVCVDRAENGRGVITALQPRTSCFVRRAAGTDNREQLVAANVDIVFVCMSMNLDFNLRRLERYLATAWDSGATPVVLLTKRDLCEQPEVLLEQVRGIAPGVEVRAVSSMEDAAPELEPEPGKTYALIGSSGVGKSTLINRLLGSDALRTGGLRDDDKGHHTTTHRELLTLPNGAYVIDTPGMRELGMWDEAEGIARVFSDIEALISGCRFSDCRHEREPGCAVRAALADGSLTEERWQSFLKLREENAWSAKAKREKFKAISKINKARR